MSSNKYSVIVFDLGNVLLPFDYERIIKNLNNVDECLGERFKKKYAENYHVHEGLEKQLMSDDEFIDIMMEWTENKVGREEFCKIYSDIFEVNEYTTGLLPELKEKYRILLLSNTNEIHREYGYKHYEFLNHFEKIFLSHEVGFRKPEKEIYDVVENYTGEPSEKHLFIDDVKEYIDAARKNGWGGIQFVSNDELKNSLIAEGVL